MPTAISTVSAAASTGRRNHASHPACGLAISSRRRALRRTSKYGDGSGACHWSSSAVVCLNSSSFPAHAPQPARCPPISGVTSIRADARSGIISRISSHFITVLPSPSFLLFATAASLPLENAASYPNSLNFLHKLFQLFPQSLVCAEQQRFRRRLAQLQNIGNLLVIHLLVLMHDHSQFLPLWQGLHFAPDCQHPLPPHQSFFGRHRVVGDVHRRARFRIRFVQAHGHLWTLLARVA